MDYFYMLAHFLFTLVKMLLWVKGPFNHKINGIIICHYPFKTKNGQWYIHVPNPTQSGNAKQMEL